MPIRTFLETDAGAFGPDDIAVLNTAFQAALKTLRLIDLDDPAVRLVASRIIELAMNGERDPIVLCKRAVKWKSYIRLHFRDAPQGIQNKAAAITLTTPGIKGICRRSRSRLRERHRTTNVAGGRD